MSERRYVPAAGRSALTPYYDRAMAITMRESRWRPKLTEEVLADTVAGSRVVDVGAGTGTQAIGLAAQRPDVEVIAVDGDPDALTIASAKPDADRVRWLEGMANRLPFADASVDRIIVSLLLHHLAPADKTACLRECRRVLRPAATLHVVDWGRPRGPLTAAGFAALRLLDGRSTTKDHADGRLREFIVGAGFADVRLTQSLPTVFGTLERFRAK